MKISAVVFDLDETLSPINSWLALTDALGASPSEHAALYSAYRGGLIDYFTAKSELLELWRSTGRATREDFLGIFQSFPLRADSYSLVKWLTQNGYMLCIISGTMDLYVELAAKKLEIPCYFANTQLIFDQSGRLADMNYSHDQRSMKTAHLESFCTWHGISPGQVLAVGNGLNDLGMLQRSGKGALLNPSFSPVDGYESISELNQVKDLLLDRSDACRSPLAAGH